MFRWTARAWPCKILNQMETVRTQTAEDEERFLKIQLVDQNNFMERLNILQVRLNDPTQCSMKLTSCFGSLKGAVCQFLENLLTETQYHIHYYVYRGV